MLGTRDDVLQTGHHLATIAHPQTKGIGAREERGKFIARLGIEQDRLRPATTGAEYVTIGEATASHQTGELGQADATADDVGHVYVDRGETGLIEGGRHLDMAIDPLLAQDRDFGARRIGKGRAYVFTNIETQTREQTGIVVVGDAFELLTSAIRVVTQGLHAITDFGPSLLQLGAACVEQRTPLMQNTQTMTRHHAADDMANIVQTGLFQHACDVVAIGLLDLYHCAQLFVEQTRQYVITQFAEIQIDALAAALPKQQAAVAEAEKAVAAMKPAADAAAAALAGPQRSLQYWQAQLENKQVIALREEVAALKEKTEDLKAEIPALEASLKSAAEKKAAGPAPEEAAKLDKQIATETQRLEEARKELAAAEPLLPEKEKAVESAWQKYLSLLPR